MRRGCEKLLIPFGPIQIHRFDEALALADRVAILIQGRVRQVDLPEEVLRHPTDPETARFLSIPNVVPVTASQGEARTAEGTVFRTTNALEGELHAVIRAEEIRLWPGTAPGSPGTVATGRTRTCAEGGAGLESTWLEGTIVGISMGDGVATVTVDVPPAFAVRVLNPELRRLGVACGDRVTFEVPAAAVHLC